LARQDGPQGQEDLGQEDHRKFLERRMMEPRLSEQSDIALSGEHRRADQIGHISCKKTILEIDILGVPDTSAAE
jgi:hypothetical protein